MDGIADYVFLRSLGQGNNGEFFLARTPERLPIEAEYVAVKVHVGATTQQTVRRATRELQAFAGVSSPYLVTLFDAGQDRGTFFYAMEYLPRGSLAKPAQPVARGETLAAVADAADAAHSLHEAGLVHRDIRPGNILLAEDGGRLSDLGLAQVFSQSGAVTAMAPIGSVEYVDPLLFRGLPASRASDIWSLGVSLHRALAGIGIYGELQEADPLLALHQVMSTPPRISPSVGAEVAPIIAACLDPDPVHRPATAREVAQSLRASAASS